jgi:L-serine dehydratase
MSTRMFHSILELFKIGIGPSSSHTVGPMKAARRFAMDLESSDYWESTGLLQIELYGSLALTGKGHGTDLALLAGLEGECPEVTLPEEMTRRAGRIASQKALQLLGKKEVLFDPAENLQFFWNDRLPRHSNGMRFQAFDSHQAPLFQKVYYSIGGGFILGEDEAESSSTSPPVPYPFSTAEDLLGWGKTLSLPINAIVLENEKTWQTEELLYQRLRQIWQVMQEGMERGWQTPGVLPGGIGLERRAPRLYQELCRMPPHDFLAALDWVNAAAIAVNEENAGGGRVVTAPTNGAAGVIPAVLLYYVKFSPDATEEGIIRFFLTAGAIGLLYKEKASISGAEVGCQGEVGVACSMAAAGLAAAMQGSNEQVENAAEIGMEHNLGMTCDPVAGLVQIPCIERNAMGAVKAINAARLALHGSGYHRVSLDQVIATMQQTGTDMQTKYKETSLGGLAVNAISC